MAEFQGPVERGSQCPNLIPPEHDTEVDKQPANRTSVSKKAWAKPTIRSADDMTFFKSGPHSDPAESAFYHPSV